jgi:hypothetical protein
MLTDERTLRTKHRVVGFLGPVSSSFTLAWLASHRGRLRTFLLGGKRLSVLVAWDTEGTRTVERDDADVAALRYVVLGPGPSKSGRSPSAEPLPTESAPNPRRPA